MIGLDDRPAGARVSADMIGSTAGRRRIAWSERDTMLYALGVGAGSSDPERELALTTENSGGVALSALPSYLSVLAQRARPPAFDQLDIGRLLHAEQEVELFRSLPVAGEAVLETVVESVLDKGAGAILVTASTLRLEDESGSAEEIVGRCRMASFVRGAGGFGGPRGTSGPDPTPSRSSDERVVHTTRPEQALLYRLSGDRNRLHSDPAFARERGFTRPILHGLSTYGFACRALVEAAGGDADRLASMAGRFRKPVYPGDTLTTDIWAEGDTLLFRTLDGAGDAVIERGTARLRS